MLVQKPVYILPYTTKKPSGIIRGFILGLLSGTIPLAYYIAWYGNICQ